MKNVIAVIFALLAGFVATPSYADNQGYQVAGQVGSAVLGAVIGYKGAQAAGANQPWAIAGGVVGANVGAAIFNGSQQRPIRRAVYRGQPQYQNQGGQYNDPRVEEAYERGAQERARQDQMAAEKCAYERGRGNYNYNCYGGYNGSNW